MQTKHISFEVKWDYQDLSDGNSMVSRVKRIFKVGEPKVENAMGKVKILSLRWIYEIQRDDGRNWLSYVADHLFFVNLDKEGDTDEILKQTISDSLKRYNDEFYERTASTLLKHAEIDTTLNTNDLVELIRGKIQNG
jgi:hypothetical protein